MANQEFDNNKILSKEEQEIVRHNLLKYCELDTYAMVKIWQKLLEVTKEEPNDNRYRKIKK